MTKNTGIFNKDNNKNNKKKYNKSARFFRRALLIKANVLAKTFNLMSPIYHSEYRNFLMYGQISRSLGCQRDVQNLSERRF